MAIDAYAYGWQGAGRFSGGTRPASAPKYGTYSSYGYKSYKRPPRSPGNPRGYGPSKTFDPFGMPWGGVPKSPPAAGVAKALSRILRKPRLRRPLTNYGERAVHKVATNAFEKAFAGYLLTQVTPDFDWWSPLGLDWGPQIPTDLGAYMLDRSLRRGSWFERKKRRKKRNRSKFKNRRR